MGAFGLRGCVMVTTIKPDLGNASVGNNNFKIAICLFLVLLEIGF